MIEGSRRHRSRCGGDEADPLSLERLEAVADQHSSPSSPGPRDQQEEARRPHPITSAAEAEAASSLVEGSTEPISAATRRNPATAGLLFHQAVQGRATIARAGSGVLRAGRRRAACGGRLPPPRRGNRHRSRIAAPTRRPGRRPGPPAFAAAGVRSDGAGRESARRFSELVAREICCAAWAAVNARVQKARSSIRPRRGAARASATAPRVITKRRGAEATATTAFFTEAARAGVDRVQEAEACGRRPRGRARAPRRPRRRAIGGASRLSALRVAGRATRAPSRGRAGRRRGEDRGRAGREAGGGGGSPRRPRRLRVSPRRPSRAPSCRRSDDLERQAARSSRMTGTTLSCWPASGGRPRPGSTSRLVGR